MKKLALPTILSSVLMLAGSNLVAATNGELGATSTGSMNVSLTVHKLIQVKNLQDINLNVTEGADPASVSKISTGCVVSNSGPYTISATNRNGLANGHYQLAGSNGNKVGYKLSASDGSNEFTSLVGNEVTLNASNMMDCQDGKTLKLKMTLDKSSRLTPGNHTDVVSVQVKAL